MSNLKTIPPQRGKTGCAFAGKSCALNTGAGTEIKVKLVANNHAAATGALDVCVIVITQIFGNIYKWPAIRAVPVKAIPAESESDIIRFAPCFRLSRPDCE